MEGVIEEGADALEKEEEGPSFDAGIIGGALRTKHYEIAGYEAEIDMAETLGMPDIVNLQTKNLNEELSAAEKVKARRQQFSKKPLTSLKRRRVRSLVKRKIRKRGGKKMRRRLPVT